MKMLMIYEDAEIKEYKLIIIRGKEDLNEYSQTSLGNVRQHTKIYICHYLK